MRQTKAVSFSALSLVLIPNRKTQQKIYTCGRSHRELCRRLKNDYTKRFPGSQPSMTTMHRTGMCISWLLLPDGSTCRIFKHSDKPRQKRLWRRDTSVI